MSNRGTPIIINASIYSTNDANIVVNGLDQNTILITLEEDGSIFNLMSNNIVKATILLPPPQVPIALIDGNVNSAVEMYMQHLGSPVVREFINTLIYVLYNSKNILIYSPITELTQFVESNLYGFLANNYGLIVGGPNNQFDYNPDYQWFIDSSLYLSGYLSPTEFAEYYPEDIPVDMEVINKLIYETGHTEIPGIENCITAEQANVLYQNFARTFIHDVHNDKRSICTFIQKRVIPESIGFGGL